MADGKLRGRRLLRVWALASIVYVALAGGLSVQPIRAAIIEARRPAAAAPAPPIDSKGPLPDTPDTPAVKLAKTVGKQAAITLAPPLLALWFGWDLWFALVGFLSRDRKTSGE